MHDLLNSYRVDDQITGAYILVAEPEVIMVTYIFCFFIKLLVS